MKLFRISRKKLVKRIMKLTNMDEPEAHGSLISFVETKKSGKLIGYNKFYPNYSDKEIIEKLKQCGYA